jgi:hypothetical protein
MPNLFALLIGSDFYFPNRLPDGKSYPSLRGCVRDIQRMHSYLTTRLHMSPGQIITLSATNAGGNQPLEPREQWPTYANMVAKFRELTQMAQSGDQLFIHYSGHGGRALTKFPDVKRGQGQDEGLVPIDIGLPESDYLRDLELAYLLQEMVEKGLLVTLALDSCHSGGATRSVAARPRGIPALDTTPRPGVSLVAPIDALTNLWQQQTRHATRDLKPASGWLLESKGYVLLAACGAHESAYEYAFEGQETHGAFTYWLLDGLRQADANTTYHMIYGNLLAKIHGRFRMQTPQLQGEGQRALFGSHEIRPYFSVPVMRINAAKDQVQLGAGAAQGIQLGARFALYPDEQTAAQGGQSLAAVEVTRLDDVDAWAKAEEGQDLQAVEAGALAVPLGTQTVTLCRSVALVSPDPALRQQVEQAIETHGSGFLQIVPGGEVDFHVAVNQNAEFEIWDTGGDALPNLRPPLRIDDPSAATRLAARLVHLAKYRNVDELAMPDSALGQALRVELERAGAEAEGAPVFHVGDQVTLRITNTLAPGKANDPDRVLHIAVLNLRPNWRIAQIYPALAAFETLDPGQTIPLAFEIGLPEGYSEGTDIVKVFATQASTQFRWLELPALDQPPAVRSRQVRSAITDPLEQLLALLTADQAGVRSVMVTRSPQPARRWTVATLELRVEPRP